MSKTIFDEVICSGSGQFDSRAKTNQNYDGITVLDALTMYPSTRPKSNAQWLIPSTYLQSDARTHDVQRDKGRYCLLTADIDSGNHTLDEIDAAIVGCIDKDVARRIYSTSSSTAANKKWRVLIPVLKPLQFAHWNGLQVALGAHFESVGICNDKSLERSAQLVYLPNQPSPGFYENALNGNDEFGYVEHNDCLLVRLSKQIRDQGREIEKRQRQEITVKKSQDSDSVIDAFNRQYTIAQLLTEYGYKRQGQTNSWRSPYQESASYATKDFGDYWVSMSFSDVDAGLGVANRHGSCSGDAFALYVHFEHQGDHKKAVKELIE